MPVLPRLSTSFAKIADPNECICYLSFNSYPNSGKVNSSGHFFLPVRTFISVRPIFFSSPDLVVGIPVVLAISRFTLSIPNALLRENDTPGIFSLVMILSIIQYLQQIFILFQILGHFTFE